MLLSILHPLGTCQVPQAMPPTEPSEGADTRLGEKGANLDEAEIDRKPFTERV